MTKTNVAKQGNTNLTDLDSFRADTRVWLEENCPASMRTPAPEDEVVWGGRNAVYKHPDSRIWLDRMAAKGWTCPTWPEEYGGGGLDKAQSLILAEEMQRISARPPLVSFGISMLGPVLLEMATHEQKLEHIPKSSVARFAGVRVTVSQVRVRIWLVWVPRQFSMAIIM